MTDLLAALERAAERYVTPWWSAGVCAECEHPECVASRASAALLRELAQRITDYREAHAADQDEPYYDADLRRYRTRSALLALVRGGEAAPTPTTHEEAPTDNG
jgi:hypothetical protein